MEELPQLISDLALILIVAGLTTIVFRRLKQPLVLGYILAGFLAGPNMPYMPSVEESETIEVWSQIGVIFLMFSLGLEFSFKKILKGGASPIVASCFIMTAMWCIGCGVGRIMGWTTINCMFVGGMLAMSSTTIIYKAFEDMGLMARRFAGKVMSVLILEDILGIVVMVILSAVAVSNQLHGSELILSLLKLGFFLLLWFLVGIWAVPTFLHYNRSFINKETLVIVSIGLCFLMVVVADSVGYSTALGAFVMGSILAETVEAERIDSAISSIKDLFGAIFFVSVGMMVSPSELLTYWLPIVALVLAILIGQAVFGTMGYLLSGSSSRDAMMSGFSMTQIGEFAFIIAALGESLKVTDGMLMPIVVAVSIITTFLTPYMIKLADFICGKWLVDKPAPSMKRHRKRKEREPGPLAKFLRRLFLQTLIYGVLSVSVISFLFVSLLFLCRQLFGQWAGNAVCGVLVIMLLSLLLRPIVMKGNNSREAKYLRKQGGMLAVTYHFTVFLRFMLAVSFIYYVLNYLSPFQWYIHFVLAVALMMLIVRSKAIKRWSMGMERTFLENLTRREEARLQNGPDYARQLKGRDLHIARLELPEGCAWAGRTLSQLRIGRSGVHVAAIVRDHNRLNVPGGGAMLFPHDIIEVVGDDQSIDAFSQRLRSEVRRTNEDEGGSMELRRMVVGEGTALEGVLLKDSGIRDQHRCMVVGFEDKKGNLHVSNADHKITHGDIIWLAGTNKKLEELEKQLL